MIDEVKTKQVHDTAEGFGIDKRGKNTLNLMNDLEKEAKELKLWPYVHRAYYKWKRKSGTLKNE